MGFKLSRGMIWIKGKRQEQIDKRGGYCEYCKGNDRLEFAHVTPTELNGRSRGSFSRVKDVINNPDSYLLLCWECHKMFDDGNDEGINNFVEFMVG